MSESTRTASSPKPTNGRTTTAQGQGETAPLERTFPEMIFEKVYDVAIARLPWTAFGPIKTDGKRYLSVEQVVDKFGGSEKEWRERWLSVWMAHIPANWQQLTSYSPAESLPKDVQIALEYAAILEDLRDDMNLVENHCLNKKNEPVVLDINYHMHEMEQELKSARDSFYRYVSDRLGLSVNGRGGSRRMSKVLLPKAGIV